MPTSLTRAARPSSVWGLIAALTLAATAVWAAEITGIATPGSVPWWALAPAFALAERAVVHLHFRRSAHSFTLGDVPLVFGLVFAAPEHLLAGGLLGTAAVLVLDRQLPAVKVAFNLAQFAFTTAVAIAVMTALADPSHILSPALWLAVMLAVMASSLVAALLIAAAISLTEGPVSTRTVGRMLAMDGAVSATNTCVALSGIVVATADWRALPLLLVPAGMVYAAYRAYVQERQRHERLEFLYDATRTLSRSPEIAAALEGLLEHSLDAFRVELAEVILLAPDNRQPLRTALRAGAPIEMMQPVAPEVAEALGSVVSDERPVVSVGVRDASPPLRAYFAERRITQALVALLAGEQSVGAMVIANRFGVVQSFSGEDRKLMEALANNASVALQHDHLEQAVWRLRELQETLHHRAFHDPLTDLANRSLFTSRVEEALRAGSGLDHAVLFIDVDDFKTINDSLGHAAGDALLVAIAGRLDAAVRPDDLVGRLGGDEFAVLLQCERAPRATAADVARRVLRAFDRPVSIDGHAVPVRLSVGVATTQRGAGSPENILRDADTAMYEAKAGGKGRVVVFESRMRDAVVRRHSAKERLITAVERSELTVEFQPIVDLASGRRVGAEALVRWNDPERGRVLPGEFVPLAEEMGLISEIGRFVLGEACERLACWSSARREGERWRMHVNLSPVEIGEADLVRRVADEIERHGVDPAALVLEVTEGVLMRDLARSHLVLDELRELGTGLALDDFGTGHSSLGYLRGLPFDTLKVAQHFVDALDDGSPRDAAFVRLIVELGHVLGLDVIAEGVETVRQAELLREIGCGTAQGFLLGLPMAAEEWMQELETVAPAAVSMPGAGSAR